MQYLSSIHLQKASFCRVAHPRKVCDGVGWDVAGAYKEPQFPAARFDRPCACCEHSHGNPRPGLSGRTGFVRPSACCEHSHATASSDDVRQSTACSCKNCAPWSFTRRHVQHMTAALYLGRVLSVPVCSCLGLLVDSLRSQLSWFCHPPAAKVGRVGLLSLEPGGFFGSLQSDAQSPNV